MLYINELQIPILAWLRADLMSIKKILIRFLLFAFCFLLLLLPGEGWDAGTHDADSRSALSNFLAR